VGGLARDADNRFQIWGGGDKCVLWLSLAQQIARLSFCRYLYPSIFLVRISPCTKMFLSTLDVKRMVSCPTFCNDDRLTKKPLRERRDLWRNSLESFCKKRSWKTKLAPQGGPIGRIFADWVIVSFGQFLGKLQNESEHWATVIHGKNYVFILTKNGLGYTLGDFFTN
jgi:hypothetical protein